MHPEAADINAVTHYAGPEHKDKVN